MRLDYKNSYFQVKEELLPEVAITYDEAVEKAANFMPDNSFIEELQRIYSADNIRGYYGNPVHYKISASNVDIAVDMASVLGQALKSNNRLEGSRIITISEISKNCYDEDEFVNLFEQARGNIILFDLSGTKGENGNYASGYEEVIRFICRVIRKNHIKTLCIFIENKRHPGFVKSLIANVIEEIDIIELSEGSGNRDSAIRYMKYLAEKNKSKVTCEDMEDTLPKKKYFPIIEVYETYQKWFKNGLKNNFYKAYKHCHYIEADISNKNSEPYDELQMMVGLSEIKKVVDEVIDSARIQKVRSDLGMDTYKTSLHMVFTGNPGSAKTTVARLLAQIFTKEGILESGSYVECGRADLVGKYVGWTAKNVKARFKEARGGILFIDEAYSLVDDSKSFGDEAINTIVQEMENHRDDVIVIFAGYPNRMKEFLAKNEGLRSRIAFHLDFPNYNAEEMLQILKLMAEKKGYRLGKGIDEKCLNIFEQAVKQEGFGNGRFARNLLEQALMAQSRRIVAENRGKKIGRRVLTTLKAEDFDVNAGQFVAKEAKNTIGFAV